MTRSYQRLSIVITFLIACFAFSLVPQEGIGIEPSSNSQGLQKVIGIETSKAEGPVTMEADRVTYDQKGGFISLEGAVRILYKNTTVQADKVIFYDQTKDVLAEGGVILTEGEDVLRCDRLELNIETKKGVVYKGRLFLKKKNFHIAGSKAEKLGESEYRVYDATLTSCDARVPYWEFTAKQLDVDIEGYAQGWWPGFRLLDIPVLYFPWAMFPVKNERQSGFLFPEFGSSSRWGPEITVPFYWAIAPNQDATLYLERIGDSRGRGFKEGLEYRYAWSQRARGQIKGFYIWDERFDKSPWWDERQDKSRWSLFVDHDQSFPGGYYLKADVNWVSDKYYPVDFPSDVSRETRIDSSSLNQLESILMLGKNWEWGALETDAYYFRDLTLPDHIDNSSTMQMLPQTTFNLYQDRFLDTPLFYEMEAQGTYFWREELPSSPKVGEILRGGRIDLYPRLSVPLKPLDIVRFEPWVGYRETIYFPDNDPTGIYDEVTSRELFDVGASLATTISRVFPLEGRKVQGLKHIIEPGLAYNFVPEVDQSHNPPYKLVDRIPTGVKFGHVFDERDRIPRENSITWMLTNYLIGKVVGEDGEVTYPEYLYLKLYQGYNFSPDLSLDPLHYSEERQHLSNLIAEARTAPFTWLSGTMDLEYNPQQNRLDVLNTGVAVSDKRGDHLGVQYRFTKGWVEELNTELGIRIIDPLDFYFAYRHNLLDNVRIETVYGLDYRHQCWEVSLRVYDINRQPDLTEGKEVKVMVFVTLSGIGKYRVK
jgi:LPS-assembly protein